MSSGSPLRTCFPTYLSGPHVLRRIYFGFFFILVAFLPSPFPAFNHIERKGMKKTKNN
jgi:hypothetical protein